MGKWIDTHIHRGILLNNNEKIYEIARLLSGDEITNSFLESAKELISSK